MGSIYPIGPLDAGDSVDAMESSNEMESVNEMQSLNATQPLNAIEFSSVINSLSVVEPPSAMDPSRSLTNTLRYIPLLNRMRRPSGMPPVPDFHAELLHSLVKIVTCSPPTPPPPKGFTFGGLYKGPTSTAYLFLQLSFLYPDLRIQDRPLKEWCIDYLAPSAPTVHLATCSPQDCGISNELLAHTTILAITNDDADLVKRLCSYASLIITNTGQEFNGWLNGRAGYLYFLRRTLVHFQEDEIIHNTIQETISLVANAIVTSPTLWKWFGKEYLGTTLGYFGILVQLIVSAPHLASQLQELLHHVLQFQLKSGNFPVTTLEPNKDLEVQFCTGSPGAVISLSTIRKYFEPNLVQEIDTALERALQDVWQRGMIVKDPCLCHGIPGNALALMRDREKFVHFISMVAGGVLERTWGPLPNQGGEQCSLYLGEAGRAWLWSAADKGLCGDMIGYNDV